MGGQPGARARPQPGSKLRLPSRLRVPGAPQPEMFSIATRTRRVSGVGAVLPQSGALARLRGSTLTSGGHTGGGTRDGWWQSLPQRPWGRPRGLQRRAQGEARSNWLPRQLSLAQPRSRPPEPPGEECSLQPTRCPSQHRFGG